LGKVSRPKKSQNEGVGLKIIEVCLPIFILLISAWGTALADDGINWSEDAAGGDIAVSPGISNVEGIWTFSLGGSGSMDAVLYQSGNVIWGAAKSEKPEPMNGVLSGSIAEDGIEITTLYAAGDVLTIIGMRGTVAGETIRGSYFRIDSLGSTISGNLAGMRTNTDTSGYVPLAAAQFSPEALATSETPQSTDAEVQPQTETADETTSGFADVHQLSSGINPRILGYAAPVTGKSRIV
jgi:hypothetical protein